MLTIHAKHNIFANFSAETLSIFIFVRCFSAYRVFCYWIYHAATWPRNGRRKNATPKPENNNVNLLFARRTVMPFFIAPKALTHLTVKRHGVHCNYFIQVVEQKVEPPLELIYSYSYASKLLTAEFISVSSSELLIIILIFPPKYDKRKFSRSIRLLSANLLCVLFLGKAIILLFGQPNRKCKPHQ